MSRKLKSYFISYAFALAMVGGAFFLRMAITSFAGPDLATYITFYPFVIFAAMFGGLGPGLAATGASILIVDYWFLPSRGLFAISHSQADVVGQVLFFFMGALISVVVGLYRRSHEKQIEELRLSDTEQNNLTQKLKKSYAGLEKRVRDRTRDLENANKASQNVLEDLSIEKSKVEIARVKEEALLESIGDGVVATDKDGKVILMNHAAEQMLGYEAEQLIGKSLFKAWNILDEKGNRISETERPDAIALRGVITTTTATTTTAGPSYFYTRKDGTKFPVAITVTPVVVEHKIIGAIDVFRDITKEKEVDKSKTEFVSLASHQLRTPLTAISWYTEMILKGDVGQVIPEQKKYLEEIYKGNKRMVELVNTLLDVSRLELGTIRIEPEPTDIVALAQSVLDEQKHKIEDKKLIITCKFDKNISPFLTDPKLLRMVFQNILANSVEYTPLGGNIEVAISPDKEKKEIKIKISDTGYGIPKNQQNRIFNKLFRADNVRSKDADGTGLGLYIVKSIVENAGGKIWFESEENKGTTFYVTLPLAGMKKKEGTKVLGE